MRFHPFNGPRYRRLGFTLVEVLLVLVLFSVIVTIASWKGSDATDAANNAKARSTLTVATERARSFYATDATFRNETELAAELERRIQDMSTTTAAAWGGNRNPSEVWVDVDATNSYATLCVNTRSSKFYCGRLDGEGGLISDAAQGLFASEARSQGTTLAAALAALPTRASAPNLGPGGALGWGGPSDKTQLVQAQAAPDIQAINGPGTTGSFAYSFTIQIKGGPNLPRDVGGQDEVECELDGVAVTCVDPASLTTANPQWTYSGSFASEAIAKGPHSLRVTARNNVGVTIKTYTWSVYPDAPSVELTSTPTDPSASNSASFAWVVDADPSAVDDSFADPITSSTCQLTAPSASDGDPVPVDCLGATTRNYPTLTLGKSYTFTVTATNDAGTATDSYTFSTPGNLPPTPPTVAGGQAGWLSAASDTVTGGGSTDGESFVAGYEYRTSTNGGSSWSAPASGNSVIIAPEGETIVQFRAIDSEGLASSWAPTHSSAPASPDANATVRLDRTAPTGMALSGSSTTWYSAASRAITAASATDALAGFSYYQSQISSNSGGAWSAPVAGASASATVEAENWVQFRACDAATPANCSAWSANQIVRLDRTAPTVVAGGDSAGAWKNSNATFTLTATDAAAGVGGQTYSYTVSGAKTASGAAANPASLTHLTTDGEGAANWSSTICDNASPGNCRVTPITTRIDTTAPVMSALAVTCSTAGLSGWCRGNNASSASNTLNPGNASISWTAGTDGLSGIARYERSTAVGVSAPSPQTDTTDGTETWQIRAVDAAGNVSTYQSATVNLDRTTPTTASSTACSNPGSNGWCKGNGSNGGYQVYYTSATDGLSGGTVATAGTGNGQTWGVAQGWVNTTWSDAAGNVAVSPSQYINVDNTNPAISPSFYCTTAGWNGWCRGAGLQWSHSDNYSGVWYNTGNGWGSYCGNTAGGNCGYLVGVYDVAGNYASSGASGVWTDDTAPSVSAPGASNLQLYRYSCACWVAFGLGTTVTASTGVYSGWQVYVTYGGESDNLSGGYDRDFCVNGVLGCGGADNGAGWKSLTLSASTKNVWYRAIQHLYDVAGNPSGWAASPNIVYVYP